MHNQVRYFLYSSFEKDLVARSSETTGRASSSNPLLCFGLSNAGDARARAVDEGKSCARNAVRSTTVLENEGAADALREGASNAGILARSARAAGSERRELGVEFLSGLSVRERKRRGGGGG